LEPGKDYNYTIKATFNQNGQQVTQTKTVPVRAGQMAVVDFAREGNQMRGGNRIRTGTEATEDFDNRPGTRDLDNRESNRRLRQHHEGENAQLFTGRVVSVNEDEVIVSDMQGGNRHTFRIPASADVMVEGKKGSTTSLKPGMQVTITPEANETGVASKIDAKTNAQDQGTPRQNQRNLNQNQGNAPARNPELQPSKPPQR
jgi:hypothetical protein